jgi:hypothetical protein
MAVRKVTTREWLAMHGCYQWSPEDVAQANSLIPQLGWGRAIKAVSSTNREEALKTFRRNNPCVRDLHLGSLGFSAGSAI